MIHDTAFPLIIIILATLFLFFNLAAAHPAAAVAAARGKKSSLKMSPDRLRCDPEDALRGSASRMVSFEGIEPANQQGNCIVTNKIIDQFPSFLLTSIRSHEIARIKFKRLLLAPRIILI